jgi:hypothetical protein
MQTTLTTDRQTPAHGIMATLYRGEVAALYRDKVVTQQRGGQPQGQGPARAHVGVRIRTRRL